MTRNVVNFVECSLWAWEEYVFSYSWVEFSIHFNRIKLVNSAVQVMISILTDFLPALCINYWKRGGEVSNYNSGFAYFPFQLYQFSPRVCLCSCVKCICYLVQAVLLTAWQANKSRDKLLGQRIAILFRRAADQEGGGLVNHLTWVISEASFILKEERVWLVVSDILVPARLWRGCDNSLFVQLHT